MRFLLCFLLFPVAVAISATAAHSATDPYSAKAAKISPAPQIAQANTIATPRILSTADAMAYGEIFALQEKGAWKQADTLINALDNKLLMGHVLFQRYMHPTKYRSRYLELRDWLQHYSDHPGAARVYRLALHRKPSNYKNPKSPSDIDIPPTLKLTEKNQSGGYKLSERKLLNTVRSRVSKGHVTLAKRHLESHSKNLRDSVYAAALGHIARGYYRYAKYRESIAAADRALTLIGRDSAASVAAWWGGLSAWQSGDYKVSSRLFEAVYESEDEDEWLRSAGAFWSARAYDKRGLASHAERLRRGAAATPHSFYGFLAAELLNKELSVDWERRLSSPVRRDELLSISALRRVLALNESAQGGRAELELRRVINSLSASANIALLDIVYPLDLAHGSYLIADILERAMGELVFSAFYPRPAWVVASVNGSHNIDLAVTLGFVHQESGFYRRARSSAGARGAMQLMPATASFIYGRRIPKSERDILFDPSLNISLGQKYLAHLLRDKAIGNNLLLAIIAYNAGPGNLRRWRKELAIEDDPLLFIESLPWRETRIYAERVMANIWVYRQLLGQESPSLSALARARWPLYRAQD